MFSFQYCKIIKTTYFEEHMLTAAFDFLKQLWVAVSVGYFYKLDPDPGPWTLDPDPKNLDPEKPGINIGLKNMSDFNHAQCDLLFKSSCTNRYLN